MKFNIIIYFITLAFIFIGVVFTSYYISIKYDPAHKNSNDPTNPTSPFNPNNPTSPFNPNNPTSPFNLTNPTSPFYNNISNEYFNQYFNPANPNSIFSPFNPDSIFNPYNSNSIFNIQNIDILNNQLNPNNPDSPLNPNNPNSLLNPNNLDNPDNPNEPLPTDYYELYLPDNITDDDNYLREYALYDNINISNYYRIGFKLTNFVFEFEASNTPNTLTLVINFNTDIETQLFYTLQKINNNYIRKSTLYELQQNKIITYYSSQKAPFYTNLEIVAAVYNNDDLNTPLNEYLKFDLTLLYIDK